MARRLFRIFIVCFSLYSISLQNISAKEVPAGRAAFAAKRFAAYLSFSGFQEYQEFALVKTYEHNGIPAIFVFNTGNSGFMLIAAEDEVYPVLGYSTESSFGKEQVPPALEEWIESYILEIALLRSEGMKGNEEVHDTWKWLSDSMEVLPAKTEAGSVAPLITARFNQGALYNTFCPLDGMGPAGRALVGCVAVAMGQICHYYRYPLMGTGTSSFYHPSYGNLSANYGSTTYQWDEMGNTATGKSFKAVAEMLYHMGVSVEMDYGPNSSGAYSSDAAFALKTYFGYDATMNLVSKGSYNDNAWANLLKSNLDAGNPMYYHGYGSGGHAFDVDGYQNNNYFHFNWGWGGSYDGYFYLSSLTPGGNDFSNGQGAIINFKPPASQYPYNCTPTRTITGLGGTIEDGSGPISNYQHNASCTWLIQPTGLIDHITLAAVRFSTETGNDMIQIYDGNSDNAPLLATFSGDTIWSNVISTGSELYLKFTTNGSVSKQGWLISWDAFPQVFCTNLQVFNATTGTFDDGSGTNAYNDNSNCKYLIQPTGNQTITASFTKFALEDGKDFLRIFDPTTSPSTLLGTYTGNSIPQDITVYNGQMMIIFTSDGTNTDDGWEVTYSSSIGLKEPDETSFIISPNPSATGIFVVTHPAFESPLRIRITDAGGREVCPPMNSAGGESQTILNLDSFRSGMYIIEFSCPANTIRKKLVIKR
jgi:hypothetical protein